MTISQITTAVSGTVTATNTGQNLDIIHDASTSALLTIALPASPINGQFVTITSKKGINTLVLTSSTGTIATPIITMALGGSVKYEYVASTSQWYLLSNTLYVSTPSSVNVKSYGATGNGSNNDSIAIQSAITAALAMGCIEVFFPAGIYLCNITVPANIKLKGSGSGMNSNFNVPSLPYGIGTLYPTVFTPFSTSIPVIRVSNCYGVTLEDFAIIGSNSRVGEGLTLSNNNTFPGSNMIFNKVRISGFNHGLANYGATDCTYNACLFTQSNINVYQAASIISGAPSDTQTFISCVTGGSNFISMVVEELVL